ncbi:MAG TPA: hypothetical protein VGK04_09945 [Thermoanaerobaculia bacterium]
MKRLLFIFVAMTMACGKRGDPRPPVPVIPKATSDLVVTQRASKLVLSWSYPSLTTAGKSLPAIRRVTVYRYIEELPAMPTAQPTPIPPPPLTAVQFAKLSQRIDSIEGANLPASSAGAKLLYEDSPPIHSSSGRPVRITYGVVTEGISARSEMSNLVAIVPLDVAMPPANLAATPKAEGVVLTWTAPTAAATGAAKPAIVGYNIYRTTKGQSIDQFAVPINPSPAPRTEYTDVPPYGTYDYRVSAVASAGPPRIESEPSPPITATFKDLVPPPPPASVTALVETKVVRLVWDAVDVPDLAGYNVYRTEAAGRIKFTYGLPIMQTNFLDVSLEPGIEYYYSVTAVDKSGNESVETKSKWIMVPKTP